MSDQTKVLYNAECPVCKFEIDHYESYSAKNDLPIRFDDLNSDALQEWGLDADTAARRLHVVKNGKLFSGIPAFVALWEDMPRYRWIARIVSLPVVHRLACWTYDLALAPILYRWHQRRLKRRGT